MGAKSLGLSLSVVRGRSLTMRTASGTNVCSSINVGLRRAGFMARLSELLNSLTMLSQLPLGSVSKREFLSNLCCAYEVSY